jgi:WD40 repeat protein
VRIIETMNDSWEPYARAIYTRSDVHSIALSQENDLIATGENTCVEIFEAVTGQRRATLTVCKDAKRVAFSPDDTLLVIGCADGTIDLWDLQTGGLVTTLIGHAKSISSIAFSPCGSVIASSASDPTIRIWSVSSHNHQCVLQTDSKEAIIRVCWTATGQVISGSENGNIRVWDDSTKKCLKMFHIRGRPYVVACSLDLLFIASGFHDAGNPCTGIQVVNTLTGGVVSESSTDSYVGSIRFVNRDKVLYTGLSTFVVQDLTKVANNSVFEFDGRGPSAISSDGAYIVSMSAYDPQVVKVWETGSMNQIHDSTHINRPGTTSVLFSGDGRFMASLSKDSWEGKLWNATTGRCLHTFSRQYPLGFFAFSPNSTCVASDLDVWDVETGCLVSILDKSSLYVRGMEFSPDGSQIIVIGEDSEVVSTRIKLLDVETGACLASMPVDNSSIDVNFGVDGTSIILKGLDSETAWRIAPALISNGETYIDESSNDSDHELSDDDSSTEDLPMIFIPIHDRQRSVSPDIPWQQDIYEPEEEWIVDQQKRRVCWVPPDARAPGTSSCHGQKVALGTPNGNVTIVDISGVRY